ncbi:MAG: type IV pilus modification protein PilV [Desulfuromonadales bacterium C00003094]|jgi:type IV pilus assembly protein PilV|nr:MAG: type IV pilus modification protein PilV [Desulfuromonadales bacterium C00003094]OEU73690.1 MAG: type IV pilus modification protein PilV [Desulfuromonadales bacterium C00003107]
MKKTSRFFSQINEQGFTLIEVLVALVIISVGLIGLAALQTGGLRNNNSALIRSQAVLAAEDILDRMRANRTDALGEDYDIGLGTPVGVTYTGMVLTDLTQWKNSLLLRLAQGDGSVDVSGVIATVVVQWTEAGGNDSVTVVTRL